MRDLLLPVSILALAAAIGLHAVVPAWADEPAEAPAAAPAPPPAAAATPEAPLPPECHPIRLGTAREMEKVMGDLHTSGRTQMMIVGSGMVCGWR